MGLRRMGLRTKILAGFVGIAVALLFTGVASLFELDGLSKSTQELIDSSSRNMRATQIILEAVHDQNTALLTMIMLSDSTNQDSLFNVSKDQFGDALATAVKIVKNQGELELLLATSITYETVVKGYREGSKEANVAWFVKTYKESYSIFTDSIKSHMSVVQNSLVEQTIALEDRAYNASTPNILTIAVLGVIIGMFLFFVDRYFIKPIININKGLKGYLSNKIPFNVKVESNDEIQSLRDSVEKLIMLYKNKKKE